MNSPETHLEPQGDARLACDTCGTLFKPKRSWSRFCRTKCRNDFHAAEARKEAMRQAAPELFEALLAARTIIRGKDLEHAWVNYPTEPALTLGAKIDQALALAGHKEPKQEAVKG
jgi:hypothetical protein